LLKNYTQLHQKLTQESKLDWLLADGKDLANLNLYSPNLNQAWQKIKGLSRLADNAQQKAVQFAAWREAQAIATNKPRKWVMSDEKLIAYSANEEKLSASAQIDFEDFLTQNAQLFSEIVQIEFHQAPNPDEKKQKIALQKRIKKIANQYNLDENILATGKIVMQFIRGNQSVKFLTGWRYAILKQELENEKQS
jgi:ribonuclease D